MTWRVALLLVVLTGGGVLTPVLPARAALIGTAEEIRPGLPWRFRILNAREVNAVSLPGGFIYVTRGMLDFAASDDELAFVLAHEVAHINQRHHVQLLEQHFFFALVITVLFGGDTSTGRIADFVGFLLNRGFSRTLGYQVTRLGAAPRG